jgi:colanic acid biosynthesis glycosyl transferase WcaI
MPAVREPLRFLLVNQFYPPDVAPTGRYLHDLARTLVERGHRVNVVCSRRSYDGGGAFQPREVIDGVKVHRVRAFGFGRTNRIGKIADYLSFYLMSAVAMVTHGRKHHLLLSLTTPPWLGMIAKWAARVRGSQHAHWMMDLYPDVMIAHCGSPRKLHQAFKSLTEHEFSGSPLVIALGPFMASKVRVYRAPRAPVVVELCLWSDAKLKPWPAGEINPLRAQRGWSDADTVLMYSGNLGLGHRFHEFVDAAKRLGPAGPRWAFSGGGARIRELTKSFVNTGARVDFLPYVADAELSAHLSSADVHLASLDPRWQGLMVPSKIQAIFAVGKPVIFVGATDNELASWIHAAGAGWIVPINDVDGLCDAILQASDPVKRAMKGEAARRFASTAFSADNRMRLAKAVEAAAHHGMRNNSWTS